MNPGIRIRVTGGPWPERMDCLGRVATVPAGYGDYYPVHGLGRNEVLVLLDIDPLAYPTGSRPDHEWWSCVYERGHLTEQKPCPRCDGTGALPVGPDSDIEMVTGREPAPLCPDCEGEGEVDR